LADWCIPHDAYFGLAGGIAVNAHTLADFRVVDADVLERRLEHAVTILRRQRWLHRDRVAQDGRRARASAGAASFRRREALERRLPEAQAQVPRRHQQPEAPPAQEQPALSPQPWAAQRRHAAGRVERIRRALQRMPAREAKKQKATKQKATKQGGAKAEKNAAARVATTDPEATVLTMPDGGSRPAYHRPFRTVGQGQVIVGVDVVTEGTHQGQWPPMVDPIEARFGERPKEVWVDGGFAGHDAMEEVQRGEKEGKVYAPVPEPKKGGVDRHEAKAKDSEAVAAWRVRMGTEEAKAISQQRGATAACVNAPARNRGLTQLVVRGLHKVKAIALGFAAAHNMARGFVLQPQPLPTG